MMTRDETPRPDHTSLGQGKGFDYWRRTTGFFLAPAVAVIIWLTPFPNLSVEAHRLAGVASVVIIFWITEAIPIPATALLGVSLAVLLGVAPAKSILTAFGDQIIFLFIGSFMLARAMQRHGLDRRIAYALLAHPWVGGNTHRTLWAVGLTAWLLSMWISNTAAVAMLFPVALAIAQETGHIVSRQTLGSGEPPSRNYTTALLLMLAFAGSVGGVATPVGTPPNLIGIALIAEGLQVRITFFRWMMFALPLAVLMLLAIYGTMLLLFPPELRHVPGQLDLMRQRQRELGAWTAGQRNALAAFSLAVFLWIMPGLVALILGAAAPAVMTLQQRLSEGTVALLAASLLFLLPTSWSRREFTLSWDEAVQIDWGTVLLFGGGIALGRMFFDTGLATALSSAFLSVVDVDSPRILAGAAALVAVIISETSSNTASASMVVPVMLSIGKTMGSSGFVLAVAATLGASLGFMLPVSTPPNAIVYGSRAVRILDMVKAGIVIDVIGILLVWAVAIWLVPAVLGS
ncbi:MAG: DASS family sodium-coupled anion symporter [Deltaproteobacteria bacterium]|nr:DASS family sodium-coupled anion symporter [Deltaproteobacteria bacterium]